MTPGTDRIDRSGSRAVLIGVSTYQDPSFPSVPAAEKSLRGVHRMLVDEELGGWSDDQVLPILNPDDCRRVMSDLRRHALNTSGVLLLYFVGHGTLTTKGDLVLAVSDTVADEPDVTGLEYDKIRSVLRESPAQVKAVVLDCCYSGRVIKVLGGDEQHLANITDVQGTYTLTAADLAADAGQDDTCTAFTGELLDLIGAGVVGGPPVLTFAELYPHLRQRLNARNLPRPNQRGTDTADKCPVAKNASVKTATAGQAAPPARLREPDQAGPTRQPETAEAPKTRKGIRRRALVLGTLASVGAAAGATAVLWPGPDDPKFTSQATSWVAFSPDGKTLATIASDSNNNVGRLWDVATRDVIAGLPAYLSTLHSVTFSPDGKTLATGGNGAELRDPATGVVTTKLTGAADSVVFSRDGKTLATNSASVRLWNFANRRTTATFQRRVQALALSPDAKMLAGGAERYIDSNEDDVGCWLWDVDGNHAATTLIQESTYAVAFSPDGKALAAGGDGGVRLWDTATRRVVGTFISSATYAVAFSPDGKALATGGDGGVRLWDTATRRVIATLTTDKFVSVAFSSDGKAVAGGSDDGCWLWKLQ